MKRMMTYIRPYYGYMALTIVIKFIGTVMDLVIPYLISHMIDYVAPSVTREHLSPIFWWGGVMVLCAAVALVCNVSANWRTSRFASSVTRKLRGDLFDKILSLSAAQTDRLTVPSLVARMTSDTYTVNGMLGVIFRSGLRAPLLLIGGVALTLSIEPVLAMTMIAVLPPLGFFVTVISRKGIRLHRRKQKRVDTMVEKVRDSFTGIRVIKALSKIDREKDDFREVNETLSRSEEKAGIVTGLSNPVSSLVLNLGMTAVVALGAWRVFTGHTMPGQIIAFLSYFSIILNSTLGLSFVFNHLSRGAASIGRITEVLEEKEEMLLLPSREAVEGAPFLEFRNVSFSYDKKSTVLQDISFSLEKGQTLGILGGTGSGKSTLIALMLRFYDPDQGEILFEGRPLASCDPREVRGRLGVVFQNDFLMADTLEENILFTRSLSHPMVEKAALAAQALPFIEEKEGGFDYRLTTKGNNLSGGQRQRVLLSRAMASSPELLILDDAASALDYKTDAALRRAISEHYASAACVVVAQRVSSVKGANCILVLEGGRTVGQGTHEELLSECEIYREIARSQMGVTE